MEAKKGFTKGTWEAYYGHDGQFRDNPKILESNGTDNPHTVIAEVCFIRDLVKTQHHAELIGAAPEMYETLRQCLPTIEATHGKPELVETIKAILAKAGGK